MSGKLQTMTEMSVSSNNSSGQFNDICLEFLH